VAFQDVVSLENHSFESDRLFLREFTQAYFDPKIRIVAKSAKVDVGVIATNDLVFLHALHALVAGCGRQAYFFSQVDFCDAAASQK
jgi:hypothetical protein